MCIGCMSSFNPKKLHVIYYFNLFQNSRNTCELYSKNENSIVINTCSPNFEKLADKIEGETMISDFENLSTRDVALIVGSVDLLRMKQKIRALRRMETKK